MTLHFTRKSRSSGINYKARDQFGNLYIAAGRHDYTDWVAFASGPNFPEEFLRESGSHRVHPDEIKRSLSELADDVAFQMTYEVFA